ncbi:MAG TPA: metallopeptidase TldD-related protein [Gemmatimonadaceae bacterium]|nr:metallopeptidase TldD-related protein [Gemmatimonadaceae bacterium]
MPISRRDFVRTGIAAAAITALPRPLLASIGRRPDAAPPIEDPRLASLIARALDSARSAGASYVDARLTYDRDREVFTGLMVNDTEAMNAGVRALVNGYWGFACGPVWSPEEMVRLGREATAQAKTNALGKARVVELAPVPIVRNGSWETPMKVDPFSVPLNDISDFLESLSVFAYRTPGIDVKSNLCTFTSQAKAFGSSDGSYFTQRTFITSGSFAFALDLGHGKGGVGALDCLGPAGIGWELYRDQPLRDEIRKTMESIREDALLPVKPVDVGRYDTVFDAASMASILNATLGSATQLDRALGYEANAAGTSYLNEPFDMFGSYQAGSPLLNVTANRSETGGLATVKWDDEAVVPEDFALVKDGTLVDFQTTRESAGWLKANYAKIGKPMRSHGCAAAPSALYAPMQHVPNLSLASARDAVDFDGLVTNVGSGIAVRGFNPLMDFQCLNGMGMGRTYDIKHGKRVAILGSAAILFRAPELWKGIVALGGAKSVRSIGAVAVKGEPNQKTMHSVSAPPALFKQLTYIDPMRKA